jgi:hypothetical protein
MPTFPVRKARRSKRVASKRRASLVVNLDRKPKRLPCLVLDSSIEGFRLRGSFELKRGHVVEIILDEETPSPSAAVWSGSAEPAPSKREKSAWKPSRRSSSEAEINPITRRSGSRASLTAR